MFRALWAQNGATFGYAHEPGHAICAPLQSLVPVITPYSVDGPQFFYAASRVVKKGSVVSILRVLTKQGGDDEKTGGVSSEIR